VEPRCRFCGQNIVIAPPPAPVYPQPPAPPPAPPVSSGFSWIFVWVAVVLLGSLGYAAYGIFSSKAGSALLPSVSTTCGPGDSFELIGISKSIPDGAAVVAEDGCRFRVSGGTFRGKLAVRAVGRAIVTIEGAVLEGTDAAVDASGSAKVVLTQCSIHGPIGIRASDQAFVQLEMGQASGAQAAILASGRSRVEVKGAAISGKSIQKDQARVVVSP
jgi:hypothetical protein